ncbi:MAG TPA: transcription elongation factor GreA [Candidatus Dojkabacteria bacterium]|jgi:transcription elongation factor GreA|nr:transcription elongation factor GreA [Candidatus Dojkabacteria bacterium]
MEKSSVYQTTKAGLEKLKEELKYREDTLRYEIANTLNEMRNQGDLSENDGYSMAIDKQMANEQRISELREKIKNAKVVNDRNKREVGIGDTVTLQKDGQILKYEIATEEEVNPLKGKISYLSPIGKALMTKKIGEEVQISTPGGLVKYKIKSIE